MQELDDLRLPLFLSSLDLDKNQYCGTPASPQLRSLVTSTPSSLSSAKMEGLGLHGRIRSLGFGISCHTSSVSDLHVASARVAS